MRGVRSLSTTTVNLLRAVASVLIEASFNLRAYARKLVHRERCILIV
jgi:hypothetical protein